MQPKGVRMQLEEVERREVPNGDSVVHYTYDEPLTLQDLVSFAEYAERTYGEIENIRFFRENSSGSIVCFLYYSSLAELVENGREDLPRTITSILFSCKDRYVDFVFDVKNSSLKIWVSENLLGSKKYDEAKVKYYKEYATGSIVKYDGNGHLCYFYSRKQKDWVVDQSILNKFDDAQYNLTPIPRPDFCD